MRWLAFCKYSFWPTNIKILYVTNSEIHAHTVDIQSYQSPLMYCIIMTSLSRSINSITKLFVLPVYHNTFDHIYVARYCLYICRSPTCFENSADLPQVLVTTSDDKVNCLQALPFPCSFFFTFTHSFPFVWQHVSIVLVPLSILGHFPASLLTAVAMLPAALTEL